MNALGDSLAAANGQRFLQQWLHRLDDVGDPGDFSASRHLERRQRALDGHTVLGSWEHLDDMEFRDHLATVDPIEASRLWRIVLHWSELTPAERARLLGVSRTTEWRMRKRAA